MLLMMLTLVIASDIDGCDDAACHDCFLLCFSMLLHIVMILFLV